MIGRILDCKTCSHTVREHWGPDTGCTTCDCTEFTINGTVADVLSTFAELDPAHPKVAEVVQARERAARRDEPIRWHDLTDAQRDAMRALGHAGGWVDTWRRRSTTQPLCRVNHLAVIPLARQHLVKIDYGLGGQQRACLTDTGRDLILAAAAGTRR